MGDARVKTQSARTARLGRQAESIANQVKIYETRIRAVLSRALFRITEGMITTPAQIDALNWPT